jgi:carotenoid cleavage dioxygenase-like enzyme
MGPVQLDVRGFLTDYLASRRSLGELLIYNKHLPSKVVLIPRPGSGRQSAQHPINLKSAAAAPRSQGHQRQEAVVLDAPPFFSFHHVNAYEDPSSRQIILDTISWEGEVQGSASRRPTEHSGAQEAQLKGTEATRCLTHCMSAAMQCADIAFDVTQYTVTPQYYADGGCRSHLYRLIVDLASRSISSCTRLLRRTVEFPAINNSSSTGRPYRSAYFAADAVDDNRAWGPAQVREDHLGVYMPELRCAFGNVKGFVKGACCGQAPPHQHHGPEYGVCCLVLDVQAILKVTLPGSSSPVPTSPAGQQGDAGGVTTEEWSPGPRCFVQVSRGLNGCPATIKSPWMG